MKPRRGVLIAIAIVVVLAGAAVRWYAPARLFAIYVSGRSPHCPLSNALQCAENVQDQTRVKDRILAASREIERDAGYIHWDTPRGRYWMPAGSDFVLPFNLAEQQRQIYGKGERAVRSGDVVLDCGANVGAFVREALNAGASAVVAVEPAPENVECLRRNFAAEIAARKVLLYPKGVWDKDDVLTLQVVPKNSAADSFVMHQEGGVEGAKVPLTTIDKLVAELNLPRVDYIKMDIEGAEQRAIAGARQTIQKYHPRLALSAYHTPEDPARIPELVRQTWSGYRMECGPCAETPEWRIRPDVLMFF
jgi:FkbM family methyltransferase